MVNMMVQICIYFTTALYFLDCYFCYPLVLLVVPRPLLKHVRNFEVLGRPFQSVSGNAQRNIIPRREKESIKPKTSTSLILLAN